MRSGLRLSLGVLVLAGWACASPQSSGGIGSMQRSVRAEAAASADAAVPADRKLIRNAWLTLSFRGDDEQARLLHAAKATAAELGGYVSASSNTMIALRVPDARLDEAMDRLGALGRVTRREIRAQDVTDQYLDLEVRIANARKLQERIRQLLDQTDDVKVILDIERELGRVTTELERFEGQMRLLRNQIALATLHVTLEERTVPGPLGWVFYGTFQAIKWLFVW